MPEDLPRIGWREWIRLPELGIERIAAKVDTGAETSVLHARDVVELEPGWVEFTPPLLRSQLEMEDWQTGGVRRVRARLIDQRIVRSSNGRDERRHVIETGLVLGGEMFECQFSLTSRSRLSYPVLLGRSCLKGRFLVDLALSKPDARLPTPIESSSLSQIGGDPENASG